VTPIIVAIAAGLGVGLLTGGKLTRARHAHLRSLWLLIAGLGLQALSHGTVLVLMSYAVLAAFAARNLTRTGMGVLLLGVMMNAAPIALDGGMPVEAHAIVSARLASAADVTNLSFGSKRHLAHRGDHLRALDDTIPDWWTHEVLSFGDLVIAVGVAAVVAGLLRQPATKPAAVGQPAAVSH
jgi:hypothetical protein